MFEFDVEDEYLGTWEPFLYDKEKDVQVYLRIRPLTEPVNEEISKTYGKMRMNKAQGVRQRQIPEANRSKVGTARVLFMWTGIRNAYVKMVNQATADFWSKCLGKSHTVGEDVLLPENIWHPRALDKKAPRPFDDMKRMMIEQDTRFSTKVIAIGMGTDDDAIEEVKEEAKQELAQEKELEKN